MRATVLVRPKQGILDPQGEAVEASLVKLGFSVGRVRIGRVIDLEIEADGADDARRSLEQMCADLLANPLIESFAIEIEGDGEGTGDDANEREDGSSDDKGKSDDKSKGKGE